MSTVTLSSLIIIMLTITYYFSSVPFLGHFPSEKTGSSLFSIAHQDDFPLIETVHRRLRAGVQLVQSTGLRLIAFDGRICTVNSEWAAFTNPWSGHIEMVVAKHTVVDLSIPSIPVNASSQEQCKNHDMQIKAIMENVSQSKQLFLLSFQNENSASKPDSRNMTSGVVSPPLTKSSASPPRTPDLVLSYNQINCLENVHRLLKSQSSSNTNVQNVPAPANSSADKGIPLTRELLNQHDRRWEALCKGSWHRRLQLKRSLSSNGAPEGAPAKLSRTEPTNSPAATPFNVNMCQTNAASTQLLQYLSAVLAQTQRQNPQALFSQQLNWLNALPQTSSTNF